MSEKFERLGNYILLEKVNAGGMAEVYLAKSIGANGINKFLAIKRILPQFADNKEFIEMFKEEAKIAVNLHHNNVVTIIDFKAAQNQLYLVMEYVQGQNLRQVLQQKKKKGLSLSLDFIVYVMREVAAGLEHAHRLVDKTTGRPLNIIHRDMSPQNIMISYDGEIKVVDFGIAKTETAGESTRVGTLKGKFSYMSPEQAEGLVIDQTSDIFSVGIILWELIADDRLFVANNEMNILKRIKECDVQDLRRVNPTVPAELERIVKKTLMKDKSLRYQTAADLQKDLTRFLNKEFPEFTPGDFSTFMKFLYESEYSLAQERMVNYARLDFSSIDEANENTSLVKETGIPSAREEQPVSEPPMNFDFNFDNQNNPPPPQFDEASRTALGGSQVNQLTGVSKIQNAPTQLHHSQSHSASVGTATNVRRNTFVGGTSPGLRPSTTSSRKTKAGGQQLATRSGISANGIRYRAPVKPPLSEFAKGLFSVTLVALLSSGIFMALPKKKKKKLTLTIENLYNQVNTKVNGGTETVDTGPSNNPNTNEAPPSGTEDIASLGKLKMLIKSNPGRARIYINSQDQGVTTPATIEVEANKSFTLTLLADGYLQYTVKVVANSDGQEHFANLTPVSFGYLSINVINAGVDTVISIDGLEIKDHPPIERYPIQSGKPIKVRAYNSFTNTEAEATVTVGADEKKKIDLILSPTAKE